LVGLDAKKERGNVFGLELEYLVDDRDGIRSGACTRSRNERNGVAPDANRWRDVPGRGANKALQPSS
jgi:hypothetical protein